MQKNQEQKWQEIAKALPVNHKRKIPHCKTDASMLVSKNQKGLSAYCFRCGFREFVSHKGISFKEIMGIRKDLAAKEWAKDSSACFPPDATKILPDEAILWIVKAGLTPELVTDQYDFCWSDTLQRVIIPVSPFSFVSRALDGRKPKYINKGEQVLYEAGRPRSVAVLVEDILSAIKVAEQGYYACASLGTALTESHIAQLITHNVKRVVIWYDPDAAGDAGASKAYNKLKYYGLDPVVIKSTYDPKLHSREYIVNLIEKGINHA